MQCIMNNEARCNQNFISLCICISTFDWITADKQLYLIVHTNGQMDRLLLGRLRQHSGITARWYSNKAPSLLEYSALCNGVNGVSMGVGLS